MGNQSLIQAIKQIGSGAEVARRMGVSRAAVAYWIRTGKVPAERAVEFHRLTKLPFFEINPSIYPQRRRAAAN